MSVNARGSADARVAASRPILSRLCSSPLWRTPAKPLILILAIEALCVTCLVAANVNASASWAKIGDFGLIFALSAVFAEVGNRVEVVRRYLSSRNDVFIGVTSVWLMAAVFALPLGLVGLMPVALGVHTLIRDRRSQATKPYRIVYTSATDVLACLAASLVFHGVVGTRPLGLDSGLMVVGVVAALATYWIVNVGLIWSVLLLVQRPDRLRDLLSSFDEEILEVATLCVGAFLAVVLVHAPALSPLVLVVMIVLRRSALVRQLQEQATHDTRTGLLNAGAWRQEAERELSRSARSGDDISLLMIDLDHFKALNDAHGHQAGDRALKAVADCLTETLRGYDAVGRYGGEEFAALLVDADELTGEAVAERVCAKIREIKLPDDVRVTASVGVATAPAARTDLEALVSRADAALYVAKNQGRDRVSAAGSAVAVRAR